MRMSAIGRCEVEWLLDALILSGEAEWLLDTTFSFRSLIKSNILKNTITNKIRLQNTTLILNLVSNFVCCIHTLWLRRHPPTVDRKLYTRVYHFKFQKERGNEACRTSIVINV